jgi:FAD-linked sulfhydryl oxidase
VCRQHNNVNKLLGKQQFDCDYQNLMRRWRTGCQQEDN